MTKTYTPKQLEVINVNSGYNMVLGGPGCGKTDILAERVTRAYEKGEAELSDMLCLTFTNRAARGMYNRIQQKLPEAAGELFVGNIHRYCSHFLFDNNIVSAEASVLDEDDTTDVLIQVISDKELTKISSMLKDTQNQLDCISKQIEALNKLKTATKSKSTKSDKSDAKKKAPLL